MTGKPRTSRKPNAAQGSNPIPDGVQIPEWFEPPEEGLTEILSLDPALTPVAEAQPDAVATPKGRSTSGAISTAARPIALASGGIAMPPLADGAPDATVRVLCVHGIGDHHTSLAWKPAWARVIAAGIQHWRPRARVEVTFLEHDHLFQQAKVKPEDVLEATARLLASGVWHGVGDLFRTRGLTDVGDKLRWTAGMVAQWAADEKLRAALRQALVARIQADNPHVICGHSLGSLVCYDTLARAPGRDWVQDRVFISLGSQIGNPFVRGVFDGVVTPLPKARRWFHLYNRHDSVLATALRVNADNFQQVDTPFDDPGMADHDATRYFGHANTVSQVWSEVAGARVSEAAPALTRALSGLRKARQANRRALLVGINEYPDPRMRLEGCVNDAYLASALLQEIGFAPEDIRVVFNDRATAAGIRERLHWLLDDAQPGDQRVFFYSGHGAQLETYSLGDRVDRKDECLVPYDFDWSAERAVVDDWLYELYSQLDHAVSFFSVLDCCHSGGMSRGGAARVRGIDPPDDVLHRGLRWDKTRQMWTPRHIDAPVNKNLLEKDKKLGKVADGIRLETNLGVSGNTGRLGRSTLVRAGDTASSKAIRAEMGHTGPYQPLIYHACGEGELAMEYRHGSQSYGAFTYALGLAVRQLAVADKGRKPPTFSDLLKDVATRLRELGYEQTPGIFGPKAVRDGAVPWL